MQARLRGMAAVRNDRRSSRLEAALCCRGLGELGVCVGVVTHDWPPFDGGAAGRHLPGRPGQGRPRPRRPGSARHAGCARYGTGIVIGGQRRSGGPGGPGSGSFDAGASAGAGGDGGVANGTPARLSPTAVRRCRRPGRPRRIGRHRFWSPPRQNSGTSGGGTAARAATAASGARHSRGPQLANGGGGGRRWRGRRRTAADQHIGITSSQRHHHRRQWWNRRQWRHGRSALPNPWEVVSSPLAATAAAAATAARRRGDFRLEPDGHQQRNPQSRPRRHGWRGGGGGTGIGDVGNNAPLAVPHRWPRTRRRPFVFTGGVNVLELQQGSAIAGNVRGR